jgi:hypothetical protein
MSTPSGSLLSEFVDTYHLWSLVIVFIVLGVHHAVDLGAHLWFRSLGNVNEAYYSYKARCLENKRRYEQVAGVGSCSIAPRGRGQRMNWLQGS